MVAMEEILEEFTDDIFQQYEAVLRVRHTQEPREQVGDAQCRKGGAAAFLVSQVQRDIQGIVLQKREGARRIICHGSQHGVKLVKVIAAHEFVLAFR